MHTTPLTDLAAPAVERMGPALDRVKPALEHVRPALENALEHAKDHLPDHLPDQVTSHLPGHGRRCGRTARAKKYAGRHRGLLAVGLVALIGGVAGWFATRRSSSAWAPAHSGSATPTPTPTRVSAAGATAPASGYAKPDLQATGAPGAQGGYADRGAEDGFGGAAIGATAETSEGRYGTGSAEPLADGVSPGAAYTIKGDETTKTFHTRESPDYEVTMADVWFADADAARAAGFAAWDDA